MFENYLKLNDIDKALLPDYLVQYAKIKEDYPNFILLFRIGDFYETYFEDAITFSNVCATLITRRKFKKLGAVLMSGIPSKSLNIYIEKLIKEGYKVVVAEQVKKEGTNKCERVASKIYTKGTLIDLEFLNPRENNYLASIYKTPEKNEYEIAYADVSTGDVFISSGNFEEIKCELARILPNELLLLKNSNIEDSLYVNFSHEFLDETYFDFSYGSRALSALYNYSKFILKQYMPKFDEAKKYKIQTNLLMDFLTRKNLELTKNAFNNKKFGSLLWSMDNCKTPMGRRLLASYISTPLYNLSEIQKRNDAISEFLNNPRIIDRLNTILQNIGDISRIASRLSNQTITPLEFLTLKEGLNYVLEIGEIKKNFTSQLLNKDIENKELLYDFCNMINSAIVDEIDEIKKGNVIKSGVKPELDFVRDEIKKCKNLLDNYTKTLIENTGIKRLKINRKSGEYVIELPPSAAPHAPKDFVLVQRLKAIVRYKTDYLIELEEKMLSLKQKETEIQTEIFAGLKNYSAEMTENVRNYSRSIAFLDTIYSLAIVSKENSFVRPVFVNSDEFKVEAGKHITAQKILSETDPLDIDFKGSNFILLTGKNGVGKSTFLKQAALIIILAQCGSFVPAKSAVLPLVDKLFTILNVSDELINKKSMHQAQIKEVVRILKNATGKSVILMDEIGKNTSYKEGISLSCAIMRHLALNMNSKVIYSTHFLELIDLVRDFADKILPVEICIEGGKRVLKEGIAKESGGIFSAKDEGLDNNIIEYAYSVANRLN